MNITKYFFTSELSEVHCFANTVQIYRNNVLFINVHSDYEENSFKNQYCFIETSLTWNDAKVRCVLYSNNLPISFFQICIHHLHLL